VANRTAIATSPREALDGQLSSPDERERIESQMEIVLSGTLEATSIVYVFSKGKWVYVWVTDEVCLGRLGYEPESKDRISRHCPGGCPASIAFP
jgi:hypothetical protein